MAGTSQPSDASVQAAQKAAVPAATADLLEARTLFIRAHPVDDTDFRSMYRYWQASMAYGMSRDINMQNVLVGVYNLAPQCHEIAMQAGLMLINVHRARETMQMLRSIAGDPHADENRAVAKRLVQLIEAARDRATAPAEFARALAPPARGLFVPTHHQ